MCKNLSNVCGRQKYIVVGEQFCIDVKGNIKLCTTNIYFDKFVEKIIINASVGNFYEI